LRQFDVLPNPSEWSRKTSPYIVVLQSHHLDALPTIVVCPLVRCEARSTYAELSVVVELLGERYEVLVAELAAIGERRWPKPVGTLRDYEDPLRRALERLFTGF
jgi:toxin CcdB